MSDKQLLDKDNSKPYKKHEIIIAVFAVLILVGFYFSQDEPQALQVQLKQPPYDLTSQQFNFIYFMTNIPNVVLGVVGGIIIDKIGIQKAGIIFSLGILLAQSVVTFSIYWRTAEFYEQGSGGWYITLVIARAFLGIFGESVHIVQAAMVSIVVPTQHISTLLGLCLSIPLLFSSLNSLISTEVYAAFDDPSKMYVSACTCLVSFFFMIAAAIYFTKITNQISSDKFVEGHQEESHAQKIDCNQVKQLGSAYWFIVGIGFALPGIWYGFLDNVVECLHQRFGLSVPTAGKLVMIPYIVCSIGCPIYGKLANVFRTKRKLIILMVPILATLAHAIIFIIPNVEQASILTYILIIVGLLILGLAFSGYVSIVVPSISMVVEDNILGTAFGIIGMANALTQSVFPMVSAVIIEHVSEGQPDQSEGYKINSLLFIGTSMMAILCAFFLYLSSSKKAKQLDGYEQMEDWEEDIDDPLVDEIFNVKKNQLSKIEENDQESELYMNIKE